MPVIYLYIVSSIFEYFKDKFDVLEFNFEKFKESFRTNFSNMKINKK